MVQPVTTAILRFWNDLDEATQHGAYAVTILLLQTLTGLTSIEMSRKGSGFDWWLGTEDALFQKKARLEVSGLLRGTDGQMNARLAEKSKQSTRSDALAIPAFVVIVEFATPQLKVRQR